MQKQERFLASKPKAESFCSVASCYLRVGILIFLFLSLLVCFFCNEKWRLLLPSIDIKEIVVLLPLLDQKVENQQEKKRKALFYCDTNLTYFC